MTFLTAEIIADLLIKMAWAIPLTSGLVQAVKVVLKLDENPRWIPLVALVIGVTLGVLIVGFTAVGAVVGLVLGLSSVGLYEFGKTTIVGGRG